MLARYRLSEVEVTTSGLILGHISSVIWLSEFWSVEWIVSLLESNRSLPPRSRLSDLPRCEDQPRPQALVQRMRVMHKFINKKVSTQCSLDQRNVPSMPNVSIIIHPMNDTWQFIHTCGTASSNNKWSLTFRLICSSLTEHCSVHRANVSAVTCRVTVVWRVFLVFATVCVTHGKDM